MARGRMACCFVSILVFRLHFRRVNRLNSSCLPTCLYSSCVCVVLYFASLQAKKLSFLLLGNRRKILKRCVMDTCDGLGPWRSLPAADPGEQIGRCRFHLISDMQLDWWVSIYPVSSQRSRQEDPAATQTTALTTGMTLLGYFMTIINADLEFAVCLHPLLSFYTLCEYSPYSVIRCKRRIAIATDR